MNCITLKNSQPLRDLEEAPTSGFGRTASAVALLDKLHSWATACIVNILHLIGFSIPEALVAGRDPMGIIATPTPLESLADSLMARTPVEDLTLNVARCKRTFKRQYPVLLVPLASSKPQQSRGHQTRRLLSYKHPFHSVYEQYPSKAHHP